MIEPINFLIKNFIKVNVDMRKQVSAASCAVQVKYIHFYDETKEIINFIDRVHASEPAFPVGESDHEYP
jgi:hypothetical protein